LPHATNPKGPQQIYGKRTRVIAAGDHQTTFPAFGYDLLPVGTDAKGEMVVLAKYLRIGGVNGGASHRVFLLARHLGSMTSRARRRAHVTIA
jgi:hypothetical protein